MLHLKVISPQKTVFEEEILWVTAPSVEGEITVLPRHERIFSLLKDGIVKIKRKGDEEYLAIGGGYLETDGKEVHILVSRAHKQDEIDAKLTQTAIENAHKLLKEAKDEGQRQEAAALLRRSVVDMKLLKRRKRGI